MCTCSSHTSHYPVLVVDSSSDTKPMYAEITRFTTHQTTVIQSHITFHSPRILLQILRFKKRQAALDTEPLY